MNYRMIFRLFGVILLIEAALLLPPAVVGALCGESVLPYLFTAGILVGAGLPLLLFARPKDKRIYAREGFVTVASSWILLSLFGALPFVFSGAIPHYFDALFECASGFTTTGASILSEVESLPRGILFWRSFTHWIGGMGVLVFVLAILPNDGGQAIHLLRAEVPGPTKGKIVPRLRQTALILYGIYLFLTVAEFITLLFCGQSVYDAAVNAFATAGTGGFSVKNASIGGYGSPAVEWTIGVFMLLFGVNFNMYFLLLIRRGRDILRSGELRLYLLIVLSSVGLIAWNTYGMFENFSDCVRAAFFQTTSIVSTAGFSTTDYGLWPAFAQTILVLLTMIGACAGSTAGGLKISRVMIAVKSFFREVKHLLRPHSINPIRVDGEIVSEETVRATGAYLALYVALLAGCTLLLSFDGFGFETNFTAALSCLNNVGPGLGAVGPAGNYGAFSDPSKIILTLTMIGGRLEIMPLLVLISPATWRRG